MAFSGMVFGDLVRKDMASIGIETPWLAPCWQGAQNDTVLDCPVSDDTLAGDEFIVAVHNPQAGEYEQLVRVLLPGLNYSAEFFNHTSGQFEECSYDIVPQFHFLNNGTEFRDAMLYMPYRLQPNQIGYLKISKKATAKAASSTFEDQHELSLVSVDGPTESPLVFEYSDKKTGLMQRFGVSIRYYKASQGNDGYKDSSNCAEGAYEFKPARYERFQYLYSQIQGKRTSAFEGEVLNQHEFIFDASTNETDTYKAVLRVTMSPYQSGLIEFDLELNGIPVQADNQGKDVTINWQFLEGEHGRNFTNEDAEGKRKFYTDSNGLEMQTRIQDERPEFNLSTVQNISSNYYPVNSAIAMRDTSEAANLNVRQVTVMNEKSQGGSAGLVNGTIELVQNRRLIVDDNKGVVEVLNETDSDGYGLKVNSRYWLQIFDVVHTKPLQRKQQLVIDQPLQYFFAFNYTYNATKAAQKTYVKLDKFEHGKYVAFPLAKNEILVRFENLMDKFDVDATALSVDIEKFALDFYFASNGQIKEPMVSVQEMDLTNNMLASEAEKVRSYDWKGEDDATFDFSQLEKPADVSPSVFTLEPQRIRTFRIQYHTLDESETMFLQ